MYAKEALKAATFNLVEKVLLDIVLEARIDTQARRTYTLTSLERFPDALTHLMVSNQVIIAPVAIFASPHMESITEEYRLERLLERELTSHDMMHKSLQRHQRLYLRR